MIPYETLVEALSLWKAEAVPSPGASGTAFEAHGPPAEPETLDDAPDTGPESVEMVDSEMVVLEDEVGDNEASEVEEPTYETDELVDLDAAAGAAARHEERDPEG